MDYNDIIFDPLSDTGVNELELINEHNELLKNNKFSDASNLMSMTEKGFNAVLFNDMHNRLRKLGTSTKEYVAEKSEYYSNNEPNTDEMPEDAVFFIQIIDA